jgi:hypothetical protein
MGGLLSNSSSTLLRHTTLPRLSRDAKKQKTLRGKQKCTHGFDYDSPTGRQLDVPSDPLLSYAI